MITLSNGYRFSMVAASGALGFGLGYSWERFGLIPLNVIDPRLFTIITKTLTLEPRKGNLNWWHPWTCTRLLRDGGACNSVGLSNKGLRWYIYDGYWKHSEPSKAQGIIVSIAPNTTEEARSMGVELNLLKGIKGIELNPSCPNVEHKGNPVETAVALMESLLEVSEHPVGIKLGPVWENPVSGFRGCDTMNIVDRLDGKVAWFDLINTVSWSDVKNGPSPLKRYGLEGGVSGPSIANRSTKSLHYVISYTRDFNRRQDPLKTPVISGGGVWDGTGAFTRFELGASAVSLGTLFLTRPWRVNQIARVVQQHEKQNERDHTDRPQRLPCASSSGEDAGIGGSI